jgi:uncharacterized protein YndB with AHSA1/START domain
MTDPVTGTFVYATHIAASRQRVWDALIDPDFTRRFWNGRVVESDWRIGSAIRFTHDYDDGIDSHGTVLAFEPPRRLSYTSVDHDGLETTVTFELVATGDVVALTLTHTGLDTAGSMFRLVGNGWSFILCNLKTLLETGRILPMPESVLLAYR